MRRGGAQEARVANGSGRRDGSQDKTFPNALTPSIKCHRVFGRTLSSSSSSSPPRVPSSMANVVHVAHQGHPHAAVAPHQLPGAVAIHEATRNQDFEALALLLEEDPSLIHAEDVVGRSPLMMSSLRGHREVSAWLLDHGAPLDAVDVNKRSAMYNAASYGFVEVVKLLMERGADPSIGDCEGNVPIIAGRCCVGRSMRRVGWEGGREDGVGKVKRGWRTRDVWLFVFMCFLHTFRRCLPIPFLLLLLKNLVHSITHSLTPIPPSPPLSPPRQLPTTATSTASATCSISNKATTRTTSTGKANDVGQVSTSPVRQAIPRLPSYSSRWALIRPLLIVKGLPLWI